MCYRFYSYDTWDVVIPEDHDPDKRLYVDEYGKPITGVLENFRYYEDGDERNHQFVKDGIPVYDE